MALVLNPWWTIYPSQVRGYFVQRWPLPVATRGSHLIGETLILVPRPE